MVQAAIAGSRKVLPHPVSRVNAFLLLYLEGFYDRFGTLETIGN